MSSNNCTPNFFELKKGKDSLFLTSEIIEKKDDKLYIDCNPIKVSCTNIQQPQMLAQSAATVKALQHHQQEKTSLSRDHQVSDFTFFKFTNSHESIR
jgi:hypothetical protein